MAAIGSATKKCDGWREIFKSAPLAQEVSLSSAPGVLNGVGKTSQERLYNIGIVNISQLAAMHDEIKFVCAISGGRLDTMMQSAQKAVKLLTEGEICVCPNDYLCWENKSTSRLPPSSSNSSSSSPRQGPFGVPPSGVDSEIKSDKKAAYSEFDAMMLVDALESLEHREHLSDAAIGLCLEMICEDHPHVRYVMPQIVTEVRVRGKDRRAMDLLMQTLKRLNLCEEVRLLFVPVCENEHWCVVCVSIGSKEILHYDSLDEACSSASYIIRCIRPALRKLYPKIDGLEEEHVDKWPRLNPPMNKQTNKDDCGVFALSVVQQLTLGEPVERGVKQLTVWRFRKKLRQRLEERGPMPVFTNLTLHNEEEQLYEAYV